MAPDLCLLYCFSGGRHTATIQQRYGRSTCWKMLTDVPSSGLLVFLRGVPCLNTNPTVSETAYIPLALLSSSIRGEAAQFRLHWPLHITPVLNSCIHLMFRLALAIYSLVGTQSSKYKALTTSSRIVKYQGTQVGKLFKLCRDRDSPPRFWSDFDSFLKTRKL